MCIFLFFWSRNQENLHFPYEKLTFSYLKSLKPYKNKGFSNFFLDLFFLYFLDFFYFSQGSFRELGHGMSTRWLEQGARTEPGEERIAGWGRRGDGEIPALWHSGTASPWHLWHSGTVAVRRCRIQHCGSELSSNERLFAWAPSTVCY